LLTVILLAVLALSLFAFRLATPPHYQFDENYHAFTAAEYVKGNPDAFVWHNQPPRRGVDYTWNHPPVGLLLIAASIRLFGDTPFGWRFSSVLFGALGIALTYLLALSLTRNRLAALLTSSFLLLSGLYFVQARTAMLDIFATVFMLGAFLAFSRFLTAPVAQGRYPLLLLGLCLGLALATKWSAAYPALFIGLVVLWRWYSVWADTDKRRSKPAVLVGRRQYRRWVPIALLLLPLAIYLLAYVPFFLAVG
jgi:dolichyl-phosphate-mannose--protein O-mannosyl transferase